MDADCCRNNPYSRPFANHPSCPYWDHFDFAGLKSRHLQHGFWHLIHSKYITLIWKLQLVPIRIRIACEWVQVWSVSIADGIRLMPQLCDVFPVISQHWFSWKRDIKICTHFIALRYSVILRYFRRTITRSPIMSAQEIAWDMYIWNLVWARAVNREMIL